MNPINNLNSSVINTTKQASGKAKNSAPSGVAADSTPSASADKISISNASDLKKMEKNMASATEIDMDKVNQIKQAISNGEYQIDAEKIAKNFFAIEQNLGKI